MTQRRDEGGAREYIAFLDSDDLYLPHKLALQVAFMEAHPEAGLVSTEVSSLVNGRVEEEYHLRTFHSVGVAVVVL